MREGMGQHGQQKIVLIIVNIDKDENKSLISNQFSLKNDFFPPFLGEIFCGGKN
jgi:hypothetical protein